MAKKERNLEKAKIILLIVIAILLLLNLFQKSGMLENIQKVSRKLLNNEEIIISEDGTVVQTLDSSNWDTSKVTATKDGDGKEVPVPKGYVGSSATGENKINEGYVIYEGTTTVTDSNVSSARTSRNQWVWVPVPNPSRIYEEVNEVKKAKLYTYSPSGRSPYENNNLEPAILPEWDNVTNLTNAGLSEMTADKLHQELQQEFDSTIESIEKYGGFYIGRYEAGNLSQSKPVVRKMNTDIGNQNWCVCYKKMKYLAVNENVKTSMIWGCLWDETLQWLVERAARIYPEMSTESQLWGNFPDSVFTYMNTAGSYVTKQANQSCIIPTGSTDYAKSLNIFDLAGNALEWTLEGTNTSQRQLRGGSIAANAIAKPVSLRHGWCKPTASYKDVGCRAYLYIK